MVLVYSDSQDVTEASSPFSPPPTHGNFSFSSSVVYSSDPSANFLDVYIFVQFGAGLFFLPNEDTGLLSLF